MITNFFFASRRRHTILTCDWSSDVCSSDLISPDSQSIAAIGPDSMGYLYLVNGGDARPIAGFNRGDTPITFTADGRGLYVYRPRSEERRVGKECRSRWSR